MAEIKMAGVRETNGKWFGAANIGARLRWEGSRIWSRVGWGAGIGIAGMALAVLILWQERQLSAQHHTLMEKMRAEAAFVKPAIDSKEPDVLKQLAAFYDYLPPHDSIPEQLKTLLNVAERNGVTLMQAEYKPQPETHADFLRYQIILPVKADYSKLQTFMLKSLQELPTLMLESVSFKREKIETSEVEARIYYALLVRKRSINRDAQ